MIQKRQRLCLLALVGTVVTGCGTTPPTTGFLSDYSRLTVVDDGKMRFISPRFSEYDAFIIDPVEIRVSPKSGLSAAQRAEAARYFRQRFLGVLESNGYRVVRGAYHHHGALKKGLALRSHQAVHGIQELVIIGFVARIGPAVSRGVNARMAIQRRHNETGIVGNGGKTGVPCCVACLDQRVFQEGRRVFGRCRRLPI